MIRCLAIDDEPLALELLEDNISKVPFLKLVSACDNAIEAMKIMEHETIDLIFLDIQMPGLTGLQFIQSMPAPPMIILITAYEKYALEGFNLNVTDYLVKPVSLDRFVKACNKAKQLFDLKSQPKNAGVTTPPAYFFVNVDYSQLKVNINDIVYIEGLKDYIKIYRLSDKPLMVKQAISTIEAMLPADLFLRIHRSFIISINKVTAFTPHDVEIGNIEIPIGRQYNANLKKLC